MEDLKRLLQEDLPHVSESKDYRRLFDQALELLHRTLADTLDVDDHEVAILLLDKSNTLRFFRPQYLERSGKIPLTYTKSFVTKVLQDCKPRIENRFASTPHLSFFEGLDKDSAKAGVIQKMMCIPLTTTRGHVFGALQIGRKGESPQDAGPDWSQQDLLQVVKSLAGVVDGLADLIRKSGI
ncbi:MAG: GAF domain-containing protein [Acidobacteria bacterium]|nr:GAF domain-containing protein [Acidobacteriota bacterium]